VLLTPEQLSRRLASTIGFPYRTVLNAATNPTLGPDLLLTVNQYRILLGGIDENAITVRFRQPSPVFARVVERTANEMACNAVMQDLSLTDTTQRKLLPHVQLTTTLPSGEAAIKDTIRTLHLQLLGEELGPDDPELAASFAFWQQALAAGQTAIAGQGALPGKCQATRSLVNPTVTYPTTGHVKVDQDPQFVARAWVALVASMIADAHFVVE
jgi:hypothetical protein